MSAEILKALIAVNLAAGGAIMLMLLVGKPLRRAFGARLAYAAWLIVPLAAIAALLPARQIDSPPLALAPGVLAEAAVEAAPSLDWTLPALIFWGIGAVALVARLSHGPNGARFS